MSNTPSDAEIEKLAAEHLKAFSQFGIGGQVWFEGEVEFARAVLEKWGTPQPVVREPLSEQDVLGGLMATTNSVLENCADAFEAGVRFAERAHGITQKGGR